ncbi:MAG: tetratricopeptide repeat protein [Candidatus Latescibacteria bacterium]|jgi:tetratricopeptide (TPR) repeat protein|nr:tetratricopeptide repeat protein [Candidatus Latescibacterota bacterium]
MKSTYWITLLVSVGLVLAAMETSTAQEDAGEESLPVEEIVDEGGEMMDAAQEVANEEMIEMAAPVVDEAKILYDQAVEIHESGDLVRAMQTYRQALKINKKHAPSYTNLGLLYMEAGEKDEAVKAYKKAVEYGTTDEDAAYNLGTLYMQDEKWGDAAKAFAGATATHPDDQDLHMSLGNAYSKRKKYPEAVNALRAAIDINPETPAPYYNLALVYVKMKNVNMATENFKQYIKYAPEDARDTALVGRWITGMGGTLDAQE